MSMQPVNEIHTQVNANCECNVAASVHTHANLPSALPQSLLFSSLPRYLSQRSVGLEIEGCWVIFSCFPLTRQRWALSRPLPPGNSFHLRKKQKNFLFGIFFTF